jgi:acetyl-CoA carboxylase carboxyl transferase subunit alpha
VSFILPFESEISALDDQLATLSEQDPAYAKTKARREALEREVYAKLTAYDTFLLSGHPLRPKALDYIRYAFRDVRLFSNPDVHGDHLVIAGEAKIEIGDRLVDVILIGQQTGPSSRRDELLKLPVSEYQRWNQGMGFPDGYRKAVHFMELAEQRGWPVVVFVDTPGADPSEFSEGEGQAFAINEVIHKTTSLKVPNLSYIISLGASGGAIAITPTNRTIMNQYATYMVISPGGCASILFRNRSPESIRRAAEGLCLTSVDAIKQGTVDEVVEEGIHPGHRYPQELLARAKEALARNVSRLLDMPVDQVERIRREKFYRMGVWDTSGEDRSPDALAKLADKQDQACSALEEAVSKFLEEQNRIEAEITRRASDELARIAPRHSVARLIYAIEKRDAEHLCKTLGLDELLLSDTQWAQARDFALALRYGSSNGGRAFHPNGGEPPYRRLHPVDWIRRLADAGSFREFPETVRYCSVDQLGFPGYVDALHRGIAATALHSGLITGAAKVDGVPVVLAINNFGLAGSSLCDEIGEKFRHAAGEALKTRTPLISVAMGGGARMQEGTPSMHRNIPKAQHALNEMEEAGVSHISVICDPTLGGTAISYGLRGDYMIVIEGSANIGFSGKRVVEQFQERKVADDFQHEAWLLRRGFVDEGVATDDLRRRLGELLQHVAEGGKLSDLRTRKSRPWRPTCELLLDSPATDARPIKKKEHSARAGAVTV